VLEQDGESRELALGARLATDVLIAHALEPQTAGFSHCLPDRTRPGALVATARRAAWTSLAFALRSAAAAKLDVEPPELETGIRLIRDPASNLLYPEIFLADAIENGAGYVSHLARAEEFDDLLDRVEALVDHWDAHHECDTSCYACLRDYANSSYHPLLDWRLAGDTLDILRHGAPRRPRWKTTRAQALQAAVAAFPPALGVRRPAGGAAPDSDARRAGAAGDPPARQRGRAATERRGGACHRGRVQSEPSPRRDLPARLIPARFAGPMGLMIPIRQGHLRSESGRARLESVT
jgi:MrfA Zn-binding domain